MNGLVNVQAVAHLASRWSMNPWCSMSKGVYIQCSIQEFDLAMFCNKKATEWCHINEYDGTTTIVEVCKSHNNYLYRSENDLNMDYAEWVVKYA